MQWWFVLAQAAESDPAGQIESLQEEVAVPIDPNDSLEGWEIAWYKLQAMGEGLVAATPNIIAGVIVFTLFWLAAKLVRWSVQKWTERYQGRRNVALVMGRLTQGVIFVLGLLVAAVIIFPTFTPASLIQFMGIGSVAIGFAFRDVLQNYLAGLLLLLTQPFRIGDQIIFKNYEGTVEDIQTRATFVRTYDGRRVVIPNAELFINSVLVNTAFENRRLEYDIAVHPGEDIERVKRIMLDELRHCDMVVPDPRPDVMTYELAAYTVNIRVRWWIEPPQRRDQLHARDQVLSRLKARLDAEGVDMPPPIQRVEVEAEAGNASREAGGSLDKPTPGEPGG